MPSQLIRLRFCEGERADQRAQHDHAQVHRREDHRRVAGQCLVGLDVEQDVGEVAGTDQQAGEQRAGFHPRLSAQHARAVHRDHQQQRTGKGHRERSGERGSGHRDALEQDVDRGVAQQHGQRQQPARPRHGGAAIIARAGARDDAGDRDQAQQQPGQLAGIGGFAEEQEGRTQRDHQRQPLGHVGAGDAGRAHGGGHCQEDARQQDHQSTSASQGVPGSRRRLRGGSRVTRQSARAAT